MIKRLRAKDECDLNPELAQAMIANAVVAMYHADLKGAITYLNPEYRRVFNLSPDQSTDEWADAVHPEDRSRMQQAWADFCANPRYAEFQYRTTSRSGELRTFLETVVPLYGSGDTSADTAGGYVGTISDVTDLAALRDKLLTAEAQVRREHDVLRAVIEAIPNLVYWKDISGHILGCNQEFARRMGFARPDGLIGKTPAQFTLSDELKNLDAATDQRIIDTGLAEHNISFDLETGVDVDTGDVGVLHMVASKIPLRDSAGRITGIVSVFSDLTELVVTHRQVVHLQQRYDLAFEGSGAGVWDWNREDHSLYLSPRWKELVGYADATLASGKEGWFALVHPADRAASFAKLRDHLRGRSTELSFEQRLQHRDGSYRWVIVRGKAVARAPSGIADRVVGTIADVTDLKRDQAALAAARKLEAVGQLAAGIAHEINTPVQYISDSVHFIRDGVQELLEWISRLQPGLSDPAEASLDLPYLRENLPTALERVLEGLGRVTEIVRSMKEFSHPEQRECGPVDLNRIIRNMLIMARHEYKYLADIELHLGDLPAVTCHGGEIGQVLLNLLVNAAHAIADVVDKSGVKGSIVIRTRLEGDETVVSIADTGCGVPEAVRDRIFEPFFTTKDVGRGTGQGLSIARQVVLRHGGSLTFESETGKGTTFFVRLPLAYSVPEGSVEAA